ncbi:MAG: hypothetical protein BVN35_17840 [Proteobacteria bacterium ST_bin11]|nr:MAG: hypothetical protein BVN35_17840 [Proteobacteria bacterium ST_bin11]
MTPNVFHLRAAILLIFAVVFAVVTIVCILVDDARNGSNRTNVRSLFSGDSDVPLDKRLHRNERKLHRGNLDSEHEARENSRFNPTRGSRVFNGEGESKACENFYTFTCRDSVHVKDFPVFTREENVKRLNSLFVRDNDDNDDLLAKFHELCSKNIVGDNSVLVQQLLDSIKPRDYEELAYVWGRLHLYDVVTPLDLVFVVDPWNTTRRLPAFHRSGVFDRRDLVFNDYSKHRKDVAKIVALKGFDKSWTDSIVEIERALYESFSHGDDNDDLEIGLLDYLSVHDFHSELLDDWRTVVSDPRFNVTNFLVGCRPDGVGVDDWLASLFAVPLWCRDLRYLSELPAVILNFTLEAWTAYTKFSVLSIVQRQRSLYTPYPKYYDALVEAQRRDTRYLYREGDVNCVELAQLYLPREVNNRYFLKYVGDEASRQARRLSARLKIAYLQILEGVEQEKISALEVVLPAYFQTEHTNELQRAKSLLDMLLLVKREHLQLRFREFYLGSVNASILDDEPLVQANAFYQQQFNRLSVGMGLMVEPFFSVNASLARKYARLGFVLAHEMAHALDFVGVNFDKHGSYRQQAQSSFSEHIQCLQQSYTSITSLGNTHNGRSTLNENFADVFGLYVAYAAFLDEARVLETTNSEKQEFFRAYAEQFCSEGFSTRQQEYTHLRSSVHSLPELRVNNALLSADYRSAWMCTSVYKDSAAECLRKLFSSK